MPVKKWHEVTIPAGEMEADVDIPYADAVVTSPSKTVRYTVVEPSAGTTRIVLNEASDKDLVFRVKAGE
jgi:hypothetical protein